ncbi:hypothetical protein RB653_003522 [Dictyostelium firmibasis]|uniref:Core Histone H2A/H2B/H3 domain-containing protein n=1 Tax=Dictyostelium firmibasis TaxID=79012 RepID=A0AAN7YVV6_9MYCE
MRFRKQKTYRNDIHVREAIYIKRLLKQVSPTSKIQCKSIQVLTSLIRDITIRIVNEAFHLVSLKKKRTLSARDVQTSVRLNTHGDITKQAISEGLKMVSRLSMPSDTEAPPKCSIPHSYFKKKVQQMNYNYRISKYSMVYLSAVVEYLLTEVLELSSNNAKNSKRSLITPRDIFLSISNDYELFTMFGDAIIPGGGVRDSYATIIM